MFDFVVQCMCSGCAKVLRFQTNRCPICRQPVERLLEIKVHGNSGSGNNTGQGETTEQNSHTRQSTDRTDQMPAIY